MVHARDESVGRVALRRIVPVVVPKERPDVRIGLWVGRDSGTRHAIKAVFRDPIVGEWISLVFEIRPRNASRRIECRVPSGGGGIVDRQMPAGAIDQVGEIREALLPGRKRQQVRAPHALASALVGKGEERGTSAIVDLGDDYRTVDREAELVASTEIALTAPLHDFVRDGIQDVVAEILKQAAVPRNCPPSRSPRGLTSATPGGSQAFGGGDCPKHLDGFSDTGKFRLVVSPSDRCLRILGGCR